MMKGIDVSKWQGKVDFAQVKAADYDFVIIRAGTGNSARRKDRLFEQHYQGAKAAGLHVGAYWYSYAGSLPEVEQEARACLEVIRGKQFDMPIYIDMEEKKQLARGRGFCDGLIRTFCNAMEKTGYFAGFYTSASAAKNLVSESVRTRYSFWCAQWGPACDFAGKCSLWQNTNKGSVAGVKGRVDTDYCYQDFPGIITKAGLNGYGKAAAPAAPAPVQKPVVTPKPAKKTYEQLAKEVWQGKWGNDPERSRKLKAAGYDPRKVKRKIRELYYRK